MNITAKQASVLKVFSDDEALTVATICTRSGRNRSSVRGIIEILFNRGYLVRGKDVKDRSNGRVMFSYKRKHHSVESLEHAEKVFNFIPYKPEQIAVEHQVPQNARTIHIMPHDKTGKTEHEGVYLEQAEHIRADRNKQRINPMVNNSSLNRI